MDHAIDQTRVQQHYSEADSRDTVAGKQAPLGTQSERRSPQIAQRKVQFVPSYPTLQIANEYYPTGRV